MKAVAGEARGDRRRFVLTVPELVTVSALVIYGIGTLAFALFGGAFFFWAFVLSVVASPFVLVALRRRRRRILRHRAARRRARVATYAETWLEWEEAA